MASHDSRPKSTNNSGRSNRPQYKPVVNRPSNRQLFANPPTSGAEKRQIVGQYMLGKTIGEGTFGKVKLGVHIPTGEKVAVKILEKSRIKEAADVRRVNREIKILKKARHSNIIQLYEVLDTSNTIFLIMECCEGGEMFDYIVAQKHVPEVQACKFFHQIVEGVDCLHKNEITHRDLKPENLLLKASPDGWIVKVVDFGLSNTHEGGKYLSTACGSPCYAAPEMIAGRKYFGPLADIWSMGVILFALVCGYLPFEDGNTAVLYKKILSGDYKPAKFISNEVRDLIRCILEVDPRKRYTMDDIRKHGWYMQVTENDIPRESINVYEDESTRQETLAVLHNSGIDTQAVLDGLASKACNNNTAMYFLFEQKHRTIRQKAGSNNQQKSRPEMVPNRSDPSPTVNNHAVAPTSLPPTNVNAGGVPVAVKPSPLFTSLPPQSAGAATGGAGIAPSPKNASIKVNAAPLLNPLPSKTPYLQTPSIITQALGGAGSGASGKNPNMSGAAGAVGAGPGAGPSLDFYLKTGLNLPLPNMNANANNNNNPLAGVRVVAKPDIPKLAVKSMASGNNDILVSQTSRPHPPEGAAAAAAAGPQTARAALGVGVVGGVGGGEERPLTRRSMRSQQGTGVAVEGGLNPEDFQPPSSSSSPTAQTTTNNSPTHVSPVVPVAPAAPSGRNNSAGGRRGKNIVAVPSINPEPSTSATEATAAQVKPLPISAASASDTTPSANANPNPSSPTAGNQAGFQETRSDAQRNKMTNQGTQNLLG